VKGGVKLREAKATTLRRVLLARRFSRLSTCENKPAVLPAGDRFGAYFLYSFDTGKGGGSAPD